MRRLISIVSAVVVVSILVAPAPATAQQEDLNVLVARLSQFYTAGNYPAALVEAQKLEAAVKARFGTNHPNYAAALNNLAMVYNSQGKHGEAETLYQRALAIREKTLGQNHPDVAQTLNNLGIVYEKQAKYHEAEALYRRAIAVYEKARGRDHLDLARVAAATFGCFCRPTRAGNR